MRPPRGSRAQSSHLFCAPWGPATCPSAGATGCLRACQMRGDPGSGRGTCALLTFALLLSCSACRGRGSAPEGARAAGQQRPDSSARVPVLPCPGAGCAGRALPRAPSGKAFADALGQASGAPPRPAPGPGACGGHSLPARQPDCVLSQTRRGASDDVLDLPRASVSFPFIGDSNSTYPIGWCQG